jgi:hypothetical protein
MSAGWALGLARSQRHIDPISGTAQFWQWSIALPVLRQTREPAWVEPRARWAMTPSKSVPVDVERPVDHPMYVVPGLLLTQRLKGRGDVYGAEARPVLVNRPRGGIQRIIWRTAAAVVAARGGTRSTPVAVHVDQALPRPHRSVVVGRCYDGALGAHFRVGDWGGHPPAWRAADRGRRARVPG